MAQIDTSKVTTLSIQKGLIIAGISVAISIVFFIINPVLQYTNFIIPLLSLAVIIVLLELFAIDIRKQIGNFWSFGQAYGSLMIMSVILVFFSILLSFIMFKFVYPDLPAKVNDALMQVTSQRLESFGMDQDKIDEATKQFSNGESLAKLQPTAFNEIKNFGIGLIVYLVINLIIAACVKKKPPMFNIDAAGDPVV